MTSVCGHESSLCLMLRLTKGSLTYHRELMRPVYGSNKVSYNKTKVKVIYEQIIIFICINEK